jgi:hypothetical protein
MPKNILDLLKLLPDYGTDLLALVGILTELKVATNNHDRAKIIVKGVKVVTGKTATPIDDDVVELVEAVLNCPEATAALEKLRADINAKLAA